MPPLSGVPHPARIGGFDPRSVSHIANNALYGSNGFTQRAVTAQEFIRNQANYRPGQYGSRTSEQAYLSGRPGANPVTGANFQHEHSIGYEPLARAAPGRRGGPGVPARIENEAPAYQEVRPAHEGHMGTGRRGMPGDRTRPDRTDIPDRFSDDLPRTDPRVRTFLANNPGRTIPNPELWGRSRNDYGYRAERYRDDQRAALLDDALSRAVQLNQLGYANNPGHRNARGTQDGATADESYLRHIEHMGDVPFTDRNNIVRYASAPDAYERTEMFFSREMANTGYHPSSRRQTEVLNYFLDLENGHQPPARPTIRPGQPQLP